MERKIRRGDIYYANLPKEEGSVQAGRRPVIITQSDWLNEKSPTVIIVTLTSKIKNPGWNCHYVLPKIKGLPKQSMVLGEQKRTIEKRLLESYRGTLDEEVMQQVTKSIQAAEASDKKSKRANK